jgi:hypothetical protein
VSRWKNSRPRMADQAKAPRNAPFASAVSPLGFQACSGAASLFATFSGMLVAQCAADQQLASRRSTASKHLFTLSRRLSTIVTNKALRRCDSMPDRPFQSFAFLASPPFSFVPLPLPLLPHHYSSLDRQSLSPSAVGRNLPFTLGSSLLANR